MRALLLTALLVGLVGPVAAAERAAPRVSLGKSTSSSKEISNKPLYLFNFRGRRDPFIRDIDLESGPVNPHSQVFSVTELRLVGFVQAEGAPVALFKHRMGNTTFSLRGGALYSPENKQLANISGKIEADKRVLLVQGEKKMHFTAFSSKKP